MRTVPLSVLLLCGLALCAAASDKSEKTNPCKNLPELSADSKQFTKEEIEAYKKQMKSARIRGRVAFVVSETGETAKIEVLKASPPAAKDYLAEAVRRMKFKPRPGCGEFRSEVNFDLHD